MPDYKLSTIPCTSYVRARAVTAINTLDGMKMIQFQKETVFILPDGSKAKSDAGECSKVFTAENASTTFPLLDVNGDSTGTVMTYEQSYLVLMSLFYHVASEQDAGAGSV